MTRRAVLLLVPAFALAVLLAEARAADENPVVALVKSKVKDPAKPFAILVEFKVKAGKEADFVAAFKPCLAATKKEPGCIAYELNHDPDHPDTYVMFEKFKSVAAIEDHLKQKHTQTLLATVLPMTEGEPKVKVFTVPE
jgi:quinol monooxygenase YgiN